MYWIGRRERLYEKLHTTSIVCQANGIISIGDKIMAIPTSRTKERALIKIKEEICNGCGLCVSVCNDFCLFIEDGKVRESNTSFFGCYGCGHCMAICTKGAIV